MAALQTLSAVTFLEKPRGQNRQLNQENTMALPFPFRSPFPLGRRKRSLEDTLAGTNANQYRPIISTFASFPAVAGTAVPTGRHDVYDPTNAQYQDTSPTYEEPDPWFEGLHIPSTPQILGQVVHAADDMADEPVQYVDSLMRRELMEQALQEVREVHQSIDEFADDDAPLDQGAMADDMAGMDFGPEQMNEPADYDACQMTQEMFDQQMEQALGGQPEPEPQPDPPEQMEAMYDQEFERMLNPFMMPGMGPGPGLR